MRECYSKALAAWSAEDYKTALREYLKNLMMADEDERVQRYQEQFCQLLTDAARAGVVFSDKHGKLQNELFPRSPLVLWTLGTITLDTDPFESINLFRRAYDMSSGLDKVMAYGSIMACRSNIISTWHIKMVNDCERNRAYNLALSRIVKRDSNVIDIGAGTGLLAMLGARHTDQIVVGVEGQPTMAKLAQRCVETNNLIGKVLIEPVMSSSYTPRVTPDVVVSETMDAGGLGEKILQIFHDVHSRYALSGRPITFCPQKLTFYVELVQSEKFWRTRCHQHNCSYLGCGDSCPYSTSLSVMITYRDEENTLDCTYTTLDPDDYDDIVFLSDRISIGSTPLNDGNWLSQMKTLMKVAADFQIPIISSGRADAVLLSWTATLSDDVELESVRRGGWDYAAYPMTARTLYHPGQSFLGQWIINFDNGIIINQIQDPSMNPSESHPVNGQVICRPDDDGVIEMVNNESLRRFVSSVPYRLSWWLYGGLDPYFPLTTEGTMPFQYLQTMSKLRIQKKCMEFDTFTSIRAFGCLFKADHIDNCARQRHSAHCDINLANLTEYSLLEYREIRGAFRGDGRFKMLSEPVPLVDIDPRQEYEAVFKGCTSTVQVLGDSEVDGILYWWVLNDEWSNKDADLPLAACLFEKRESVHNGQMMTLNVFVKDCELIISHGEEHLDAAAV